MFFQVGDAADPELPGASPIRPGGVEERDRPAGHAALPQPGKESVLRSREERRHLTGTSQRRHAGSRTEG